MGAWEFPEFRISELQQLQQLQQQSKAIPTVILQDVSIDPNPERPSRCKLVHERRVFICS